MEGVCEAGAAFLAGSPIEGFEAKRAFGNERDTNKRGDKPQTGTCLAERLGAVVSNGWYRVPYEAAVVKFGELENAH